MHHTPATDAAEALELPKIAVTAPAPPSVPGARAASVQDWQSLAQDGGAQLAARPDWLAEEVPVALVYNDIAHAVMMASPLDLADFALGFSLSEQILATPAELYDLEITPTGAGFTVQMDISSRAFMQLKAKKRSMAGRTGCGLCGVESLAAFDMQVPRLKAHGGLAKLRLPALQLAHSRLRNAQVMNAATGAMHAAAWVDANGEIVFLREDVGRHNALDKLIGALAKTQASPGFCLLTSRASYELVQKAARAGMPLLATVSAPTALALELAQQANLCLLGFVRGQGAVCYHMGDLVELG